MAEPGRACLVGKRPEPCKPLDIVLASTPAFIERPCELGQRSTRRCILGLEPCDRPGRMRIFTPSSQIVSPSTTQVRRTRPQTAKVWRGASCARAANDDQLMPTMPMAVPSSMPPAASMDTVHTRFRFWRRISSRKSNTFAPSDVPGCALSEKFSLTCGADRIIATSCGPSAIAVTSRQADSLAITLIFGYKCVRSSSIGERRGGTVARVKRDKQ